MADESGKYVIQRGSESRLEWWTGSGWTENRADARRYAAEPHPNEETGDESASAETLETET
ncbi:MAG: hypothetical protein ACM3U2_23930 [Deltaproteobacteria bacterium]